MEGYIYSPRGVCTVEEQTHYARFRQKTVELVDGGDAGSVSAHSGVFFFFCANRFWDKKCAVLFHASSFFFLRRFFAVIVRRKKSNSNVRV